MQQLSKITRFAITEFGKTMSIMLGVWFLCSIGIVIFICTKTVTVTGPFGDTFGIVNSLFSSLALGALWYSIQLQKQELTETRAEFIKQSKSLEDQSKSMEIQNENESTQRFQTMLFSMIETLRKTASEFRINPKVSYQYRDGVDQISLLNEKLINRQIHESEWGTRKKSYSEETETAQPAIQQYLASINLILDFIGERPSQNFYYALVASSFSAGEKAFLGKLCEYGHEPEHIHTRLKKVLNSLTSY